MTSSNSRQLKQSEKSPRIALQLENNLTSRDATPKPGLGASAKYSGGTIFMP